MLKKLGLFLNLEKTNNIDFMYAYTEWKLSIFLKILFKKVKKIITNSAGITGILLLFVFLLGGLPVWASLGLSGMVGIGLLKGWGTVVSVIQTAPFSVVASYTLSAIPLFIIMGSFSFHAGIGSGAYEASYNFLGRIRGGLAISTILASSVLAATTGSSVASASIMCKVAFPEMQKYKYDLKLAGSSIAAGGLLGVMIPPSILFVLYGFMANVSVSKMLIAGIIPGTIIAMLFCVAILLICVTNPSAGPASPPVKFKKAISSLKKLWGAVALIVIIIGGILFGIFTPTEAAAVGSFTALIFMFVHGGERIKSFSASIFDAISTTAMIFALVIGANIFATFLGLARVPQEFSRFLFSAGFSQHTILLPIILIFFLVGMFFDTISGMIITLPILLPIVRGFDLNLIWFGVIVVTMLQIGLLTPPVGLNVYVVKGLSPPELKLNDLFIGIIPFLFALFIALSIFILFPQIVMWLPNKVG